MSSTTSSSYKCRLCGLEKTHGSNVYSVEAQNRNLMTKINKYIPKEIVRIVAIDGLPKYICSDCETLLDNFTTFCSMVKEVQIRFEKERVNKLQVNCHVKKKSVKLFNDVADRNIATVSICQDGKVECMVCKIHLDANDHITLHMVTHGIGTVICCCQMCGEEGDLKKFIINCKDTNTRENVPSLQCYSCSRFNETVNSETGKSSTSSKAHSCEICSKVFHSDAHLLRHKVIHSGSKPFLCEVCGTGFSQRSSLKLHVLSHSGLNPHKCHQCGQTFRFKVSLNSHMLSMHNVSAASESKGYSCDRCGKLLATKYKLRRHYRSHTGERPYECPRCLRLFSQTGNLNLHLKKHYEEDAGTVQHMEPYNLQMLAKSSDPVQYIPQPDNNLLNDSDPKFLESIFQGHSGVSCDNIEHSRNPLSTMDSALLNSSATESSHESQYVTLDTDFVTDSNHLSSSEYLGISMSNNSVKNIHDKHSLELFSNYSQNSLLFIDESTNLQDATSTSEGVSLPTFSSLQGGGTSSNLPHSHTTL